MASIIACFGRSQNNTRFGKFVSPSKWAKQQAICRLLARGHIFFYRQVMRDDALFVSEALHVSAVRRAHEQRAAASDANVDDVTMRVMQGDRPEAVTRQIELAQASEQHAIAHREQVRERTQDMHDWGLLSKDKESFLTTDPGLAFFQLLGRCDARAAPSAAGLLHICHLIAVSWRMSA
jgi:hypothetical protein